MKSLIIVESHNDKFFIEKLRDVWGLENIEFKEPICARTDYECLGGLSEKKLSQTLDDIKFSDYQKIGIIIDADNEGIEKQIALINRCARTLKDVSDDFEITKINEFIRVKSSEEEINYFDVEIGCYIMNKDGVGELETVLKAIKSKDSTYANCLEAWRKCLEEKGKPFKAKSYDKLWVNFYQRYDNCKENESNADENCKGEIAIKKDIWDFTNPILDDLKSFLTLLSNQ
ncbi:MAG: hypothetical protein OEL19_09155 [Sulfurimonas sp.]|nr:hypothetical protein [Sulfurimonas sp.]